MTLFSLAVFDSLFSLLGRTVCGNEVRSFARTFLSDSIVPLRALYRSVQNWRRSQVSVIHLFVIFAAIRNPDLGHVPSPRSRGVELYTYLSSILLVGEISSPTSSALPRLLEFATGKMFFPSPGGPSRFQTGYR